MSSDNKWWPADSANMALFTDLYELTMLQAYFEEGMTDRSVFSLFVRRLPENRNFLLACGLESVLDYLENLQFSDSDIDYLASQDRFSQEFLDWLHTFQFSGDVHAVAEGTPVFANEPILEIEAALPEAQLIETLVMNQVHLQTVLASKAVRVAMAAQGRTVVDFGARRMHGIDAALKAARTFYIGGIHATSNVLAGKIYAVPLSGTMAHSYIQAHGDESDAFRNFSKLYPGTILLVDTYDTLAGVRKVIDLVKNNDMEHVVRAVRLDSGDLAQLARETRRLLDAAGLEKIQIVVSGGLNEYEIAGMVADGVPVDGFGVGTHMGVSRDAPDLDIAYKLCEYAGEGRLKLAANKPILPGRKQVFREANGAEDTGDVIARAEESLDGRPLLQPVMRNGTRMQPRDTDIESTREYAQQQVARLPATVRGVQAADPPYPVEVSDALSSYQEKLRRQAMQS